MNIYIYQIVIFLVSISVSFANEQSKFSYWETLDQATKDAIDQEVRYQQEENINPITIATRFKQRSDEAPSVVSLITADEIKRMGAKNLEEVLRQVTGFDVYPTPNDPYPQIGIRGFSNNSNEIVKLLINGHPISNTYATGLGIYEGFPVGLIQKIEIIRGPGASLYGNSAMIGVINIITKDETQKPYISTSFGSFDTYRLTTQYATKKDDLGVYVFGDYFTSNGDSNLIESDFAAKFFGPNGTSAPGYTHEGFDYTNVFGKLTYHDIYLMGFYSYTLTELPLSITKTLTSENTRRRLPNAFLELGFNADISSHVQFDTKIYADYFSYNYIVEYLSSETTALLNQFMNAGYALDEPAHGNMSLKHYKLGSETNLNYHLNESIDGTAGFQYEYHNQYDTRFLSNCNGTGRFMFFRNSNFLLPYQHIDYQDTTDEMNFNRNDSRSIFAIYIQGQLNVITLFSLKHIGKTLSLTMGIRHDSYNDVGNTTNPRFGLVYAPNDRLFFKALYGQAFRAPNFRELYNRNNPVRLGNPDLDPETIETKEGVIGIHITDQFTITVDYFHSRMNNMISFISSAESSMSTLHKNTGTQKARGMETEIRLTLDDHTYGYMNATYQEVRHTSHETIYDHLGTPFTQPDYYPGNIPYVIANIGMNIPVLNHIDANIWVNYLSERKRSDRLRFTKTLDDTDGTVEKIDSRNPIDARTYVNLSLTFGNFSFAKQLSMQVTAYNVFNVDDRIPDPEASIINDVPRWGRMVLASICYDF